MAKNTRSGLGRGLNSLLSSASDSPQRTTERERIVYNENEDVDYSNQDAKLSGRTGNFDRVAVDRPAPNQTTQHKPVSIPEEKKPAPASSSNFINASISQPTAAPHPVEKNVSRETLGGDPRETKPA